MHAARSSPALLPVLAPTHTTTTCSIRIHWKHAGFFCFGTGKEPHSAGAAAAAYACGDGPQHAARAPAAGGMLRSVTHPIGNFLHQLTALHSAGSWLPVWSFLCVSIHVTLPQCGTSKVSIGRIASLPDMTATAPITAAARVCYTVSASCGSWNGGAVAFFPVRQSPPAATFQRSIGQPLIGQSVHVHKLS